MAATIRNASSVAIAALVHPVSVRGLWQVANSDLETADSATNLLKPHLVTRADVYWLRTPTGATRVLMRGRNDAAATTFTTDPVVRIIGAFPTKPGREAEVAITDSGFSGTPGDANHAEFMRLDNADAGATGITLDHSATGNIEDASYEYTDLPDLTGYDLKGATYVGMLVETAAAVTGGAANAVFGMYLFLN